MKIITLTILFSLSQFGFAVEFDINLNSTATYSPTSAAFNINAQLTCSDPLINPSNLERDTRRLYYISDSSLETLAANVPPTIPTFSHQNWPADHLQLSSGVSRNEYLALKFKTHVTDETTASFIFANPPLNIGPPSQGTTYSISECPGDFRQSLGKCLKLSSSASSLFWSTEGIYLDSQVCNLDKNKVYYFNIINSNDAYSFEISSCPQQETHCGIMFFSAE